MSEQVILAIIAGVVAVLVAYLEKIRRDARDSKTDSAAARQLSHEVHESMNNRSDDKGKPIPLSDRLDQVATKDDIAALAAAVKDHGSKLIDQRRDILGIREDAAATREEIGQLHGQDRALRAELAEQGRQVADLHSRYGNGRRRQ
ncbi:hypothetical protein [Arthrobacter silvisoli]|uniref:hypothetical protein n=1 Tax=Arthrobacter silvisoli TaxID=2291022 RepID=UPI000E20E7A3|nr:hypothetical protein [Arthrobacter silvisoli]